MSRGPTCPPPAPAPARARALLRSLRVTLLVLLEMFVAAALCSRRLHRRLPATPDPRGGTWPLLATAYLLSGSGAAMASGGAWAGQVSLVTHACVLAALFACTPTRLRPVLAIYLCVATGVALLWAPVVALAGPGGAAPAVAAGLAAWQAVAVLAGVRHRAVVHGR
jgi:hypothetical protein